MHFIAFHLYLMMHPTALQIEDVNDVIFFIDLAFLKKIL